MALSPADQAVLVRLNSYNGNGHNITTNPYGFARGGNQAGVFVAALQDVSYVGSLVASLVALAQQAATDTAAAAILIAGGPVSSVAGVTGNVTLAALVSAGVAPKASPVFTDNAAAPTPAAGDNSTRIATTAFVTAADATISAADRLYALALIHTATLT